MSTRDVANMDSEELRRRRIRPWAIAGACAVAVITGGVTLSYTSVFGARRVQVEGERHLGPNQIMHAAEVGIGTNVVHFDREGAEARLEMEPWILDATVEASLPGTIRIQVTERTPLLTSELDGGRVLLAGDGTVLGRAPWTNGLPQIATAEGVQVSAEQIRSAGTAVRAMAPRLRGLVETIVVGVDDGFSLVVDGHVDVRYGLPEEAIAKARALQAIIEFAHRAGKALVSVDVSAPAAPTARFEGSPSPPSVPDPSFDAVI